MSALCTAVGAVPALLLNNVSHRVKDNLLAYSAGIMVAASTYALIPSTLKLSNMFVLTLGILLGTAMLTILEIILPHEEVDHSTHGSTDNLQEQKSIVLSEKKDLIDYDLVTVH
jgi:ZIP family zinc transporter